MLSWTIDWLFYSEEYFKLALLFQHYSSVILFIPISYSQNYSGIAVYACLSVRLAHLCTYIICMHKHTHTRTLHIRTHTHTYVHTHMRTTHMYVHALEKEQSL